LIELADDFETSINTMYKQQIQVKTSVTFSNDLADVNSPLPGLEK